MTNPASEDIKDILVSAGVGVFGASSGWCISVSREPKSPNTCITIYDNGGASPHPNWALDELDIQVRIRGGPEQYQSAYDKVLSVRDALLGLPTQTVNSSEYVGVIMRGDFNFIEYDDSDRPLFTMNFIVWREPPPSGYRDAFS